MKISYLHLGAVIVALTACASNRQDATSTTTLAAADAAAVPVEVVAAPVEPGPGSDALICKQTKVIGSLIPKRTCKTRAQIEQERLEGKAFTDSLQGSGPSSDPSAPRDLGKFGAPGANQR